MAGRPTKRTPETEKKICDALRAGNTRRASCQYAGIHEVTFERWLKHFADFADAVTRAESECEVHYVAILKQAATGYDAGERVETTEIRTRKKKTTTTDPKTGQKVVTEEEIPYEVTRVTTSSRREFDWRAAESWLKRRRKDDWSERQEQTGKDGSPIEHTVTSYAIHTPGTGDKGRKSD